MERFAIKIDKKLKASLYKICRLCGIDNEEMVPILTEKQPEPNAAIDVEAELEMVQKINLLIGLTITKDDKMPQTMCCLCVDKINDFFEFREMCYSTNTQTRKLLGLKNVKKPPPPVDIKPKIEIKEESIVPTNPNTPSTSVTAKNGNRKRKSDELILKEESPATPVVLPKKKSRYSAVPSEPTVKEETTPVPSKKKSRSVANEDPTPAPIPSSSKKSKNVSVEEAKLKKEPSPPVPASLPPAVSNKKLRMALPTQKEAVTKKTKVKGGKIPEAEVKDEIKEEVKEEPLPAPAVAPPPKVPPAAKVPPGPKLKFGCNICTERFATKHNLETHIRTTHLPKIERYVCTACNEVLSKSFDIKNHQLWHKLSKTPYVCGCCGESILNTYAFSRHLREHAFDTPPALLVLDRECPQCHTSYATNFLYNIHICAVKTKRCAGCNRLQRNEAEYLKHSAQCAKVYLNYSKHIMPSVEALEDAVRIKNENEVEAAAEEMARASGLPVGMAPVVQLTRLSSPLIFAANQSVSMTGLDDGTSTSSKKSGKKGVSKKDLKRVDELLKSTLDALVSIKHEPEVHVEPETPCVGEHSDNDDHNERREAENTIGGLDDHHHNDDDSDNDNVDANVATTATTELALDQVKIKQEIDETNEENANKIGGLKLKIKKEHGQLNSSIIEQQKSSEKRAEKRKKKKKHKDKEKEKQKSKDDDVPNEINSSEDNLGTPTIRIKTEPRDETNTSDMHVSTNIPLIRPQPEATIMTSIPMMQFQIACVSSGVEFNSGVSTVAEIPVASVAQEIEPQDVKPNRAELDRLMKISHVSGGIAMETDENETQAMDHDGNNEENDNHEECNEDEHHEGNDDESDHQDENQSDHFDGENEMEDESGKDAENETDKEARHTTDDKNSNNAEIIAKKIKKPLLKPKSKLPVKPQIQTTPTNQKSRNKACKSTAKPGIMPILQISAVRSGVPLEPLAPCDSDFTPIFIKPEPQNRGYSDEQPAAEIPTMSPHQTETLDSLEEVGEIGHSVEEQNYISSIDFNNITIKQEKGIEITDVQINEKSLKSFADINGIKRKRKQQRRPRIVRDKNDEEEDDNVKNDDGNREQEEDEEVEDENDDIEEAEEEEEEEEEFDEDEEEDEEEEEQEEEEEEREYRELEYPPQLIEKNVENETETKTTEDDNITVTKNEAQIGTEVNVNNQEISSNPQIKIPIIEPVIENPSFVISSICSQASIATFKDSDQTESIKFNEGNEPDVTNHDNNLPSLETESVKNDLYTSKHESETQILNSSLDILTEPVNHNPETIQINPEFHLPAVTDSVSDLAIGTPSSVVSNETQAENANCSSPVMNSETKLQLRHPFEVETDRHIAEVSSQEQRLELLTPITLNSDNLCAGIEIKQEHPEELELPEIPINIPDSQVAENQLNSFDHSMVTIQTDIGEENNQNTNNLESQPQTSQDIETVFKISSVTSTALDDVNNTPISNNDSLEVDKANQEETTAAIEGLVEEAKDINLQAQPFRETAQVEPSESNEMEVDENYENEDELEDDDNAEDDSTTDNNLEERQNYQNQEVLTQVRPAALALHPYLEDISSSSNSLLSNSLSQTPPPASQSVSATSTCERQRLLNTEETENILNESNDAINRRPYEETAMASSSTSTGQAQLAPLAQHLPPNMPTFNFDNINEIAENNNNANIEREQLQDGQQQQIQ